MQAALRVEGVGKRFRHRSADATRTFRGWVSGGFRVRQGAPFWALRDVGFSLAPGEMLGVIGRNGSGKSTLLRLLGGVMQPDEGRVTAAAPVNGLLELNTGMHPDLSGRENIRINGVLGGLLLAEIEARMDQIIDFAELEAHIDDPVRTYSSGMKLRLGFAVAVHVDPAILLIDEVLAVGDLGFQQKCLARIREFKQSGCAIVLISHDLTHIQSMCDSAIWLDRGRIGATGIPFDVIWHYQQAMEQERLARASRAAIGLVLAPGRSGSGEAELSEVTLEGPSGAAISEILPGAAVTLRAKMRANVPIAVWQISVSILDEDGRTCLDVNTDTDRITLADMGQHTQVALAMDRLDLGPGKYRVSVGLWQPDWDYAYDFRTEAASFIVTGGVRLKAPLSPPRRWDLLPPSG